MNYLVHVLDFMESTARAAIGGRNERYTGMQRITNLFLSRFVHFRGFQDNFMKSIWQNAKLIPDGMKFKKNKMFSKILSDSQTLHGIIICTENITAIEAYRTERIKQYFCKCLCS